MTIRARLTAVYAGLFLGTGALLLGVSYWLVSRQFARTLPDDVAADELAALRWQYALALVGATLVSVALGWLLAGRALRPLAQVTEAAQRVSQDRLDERLALDGPRDELRELADTFDRMLDRLAEAFAAQRRFVANASHELRTPLTVIRTEVDVALADPDASRAELRAMGEAVRAATIQCEELLVGLLTLARSEAGVVRHEAVDLAAAARAAGAGIGTEAAALGVTVDLRGVGGPVVVNGERRLLERLVANLVENGVRHNFDGGWVTVVVCEMGDRALVRVENSGPVVAPEAASRLLEPFQRATRYASGAPGAGLGLSIVKTVAGAHGGGVRLEPRAEGGMVATVELPVTGAPAAPPAPRLPAARPSGSPAAARR